MRFNVLDNKRYKIRIRKGNFEVEVQGDMEWVEKKFEELTTKELSIVETKALPQGMPETLGEFLDQKGNPQRHTDVVVVFAYWLFKVENMASFNVKDIVDCYDKTRKPKPSNVNQIINNNVANHFFAEAAEKKDGYKAWIITRTGEKYVERMK